MNRLESTIPPRAAAAARRPLASRGPRAAPAAAVVLAALAGGCARERPDLLVVSLDTVRADVFLEEADAQPALAALLAESVVYERGYTPMAFTLPAHLTVFTGLPPRVHGVDTRDERLGGAVPTLAEHLARAGYATAGVVNVGWLAGSFGFARGFESWELVPAGDHAAPEVARRALLAAGAAGERPSLLFVHFFDAHSDPAAHGAAPYVAPGEPPAGEAETRRLFCDGAGACATDFLVAANRAGRALDPAAAALARELYRRGVRRLLADLAGFLAEYDARRGLDRAVLAIFSDHGEEFGEHGRMLHSQVYEETARVPIVLRDGPRRVVARPSGPVELGDLFATLARRAGVEVAGPPLPGRDLLDPGALDGEATPVFLQDKQFHGRAAVRLGDWKLHLDRRTGGRRLFDLAADPGERDDRAAAEPARAAELAALLERRIARERELAPRWRPERRGPLEREELESLRALGYLR